MQSEKILLLVFCIILVLRADSSARVNSTSLYNEAKDIALKGDIDNTIAAFKKVLRQNSHYALGHYGLGKAYLFKNGAQNDAIKHLRLAVAYDRQLAKGYFYLGLAYMFAKRYEQAVHSFSSAYEYDKSMIEALYNIAVIYDIQKVNFKSTLYYDRFVAEKIRKDSNILF